MNILIIYGSTLGKTARIAGLIASELRNLNHDVTLRNVTKASTADFNEYDLIILGSSTWDDGMLQFDFRPFAETLKDTDLSKYKFAIFCLGSEKYPHPFYAGKILEEIVLRSGGKLISEVFNIDLDHDDEETLRDNEIIEWVRTLNTKLQD